jgi:zinc/manganese transport system permease protein
MIPVLAFAAMFEQGFVQNAFIAGTAIALAAGLIGYFVVLRNQVFVTDVLSHVAFTGAVAAYAFAADPLLGLLASTIGFGLIFAGFGGSAASQDVVTGSVFAWVLGIGVLFLSIYTTGSHSGGGSAGINVLFGSIYGVDRTHALIALAVCGLVAALTLFMARPLLFASLDPEVAAARGLPVRALAFAFVTMAAITVAEAVQVVGSLLLLGLIVTPAAAAVRMSTRPGVALLVSPLIAAGSVWAGLVANYYAPKVPVSFAIVAVAFAVFLVSVAAGAVNSRAAGGGGTSSFDRLRMSGLEDVESAAERAR